ncbi:DNA cytosine methyltransferase [Halodesulfovibrio marinisediminis]|uniref:DNA (cytosine-5-)-methyltransferase n=1 Tax=Halodesulfovibrio marinisediminis DSM 17456 TaxID=1121457 RepID=A0A1N6IWR9_9BACT|nr:DNA cytosine methyltransferase [Halodesulfovibrio marinisediminis]SIO36474.1 DNA (cytosine-5)-methyltransferase 1 [Halodesulfovibrio marinisediminis DSM 17456]
MNIYSFFSGLGFLDLGFEYNGFEIKMVNEVHSPFLNAYAYARNQLNHIVDPATMFNCSIDEFLHEKREFLSDSLEQDRAEGTISGFIGGPPCPDFSVGGKNKGHKGENGILSATYTSLILTHLPDFFVFENVKGLIRTKKHREFYDSLKNKLSQHYNLTDRLLNSIEFSAPQDRERVILIGLKKNTFTTIHSSEELDSLFPWDANKTFPNREAFAFNWPTTSPFVEDSVVEPLEELPVELTVQYWFEQNNVASHPNGKNHFTPRGGLQRFQTVLEGDDSKKSYKRLHRWRYSPTACYGNNEVHLHPYKARRISAAEALAIQSLPTQFSLPPEMSLTNMFKGIGNGVPFIMANALANTLRTFLMAHNG